MGSILQASRESWTERQRNSRVHLIHPCLQAGGKKKRDLTAAGMGREKAVLANSVPTRVPQWDAGEPGLAGGT